MLQVLFRWVALSDSIAHFNKGACYLISSTMRGRLSHHIWLLQNVCVFPLQVDMPELAPTRERCDMHEHTRLCMFADREYGTGRRKVSKNNAALGSDALTDLSNQMCLCHKKDVFEEIDKKYELGRHIHMYSRSA